MEAPTFDRFQLGKSGGKNLSKTWDHLSIYWQDDSLMTFRQSIGTNR